MANCTDVGGGGRGLRDLLPEFVAAEAGETGSTPLAPADAARVRAHLDACEACRDELALLRTARRAEWAATPSVDTGRIVAALPSRASVLRAGRRPARASRGLTWAMAAAISTILVGSVSVRVLHHLSREGPPADRLVVAATPASGAAPAAAGVPDADLEIGGGLSHLTDAQLQAILGTIDDLDALPDAEPEAAVPGVHAAADGRI